MHVLLIAMGSLGSTLPYIHWAEVLKRRGHRVTLLANEVFQEHAVRVGVEFVPTSSSSDYREFLENQARWKGQQAAAGLTSLLVTEAPRVYHLLEERFRPGETVAAAAGYALGARIAQEKLGLPLATVHLQPMWFRSRFDPPGVFARFPHWLLGGIDRLIDVAVDRTLGPAINGLRGELGLPPARRLLKTWWNSPQQVIGFFPEWFNPPQPDWPAPTLLPGFPLPADEPPLPADHPVRAFLEVGGPPLVFSQSSITLDRDFFMTSAQIARQMGERAIILTSHTEQAPADLPAEVRCFPFIPLAQLLPRARAHVHHGGIGTIGHSLAAGVPQLAVPMVNDQHDNSLRLERLGVSATVRRADYSAARVVPKLEALLSSTEVNRRCADFAARCQAVRPLDLASEVLERLAAAT